MTTIDMSSVLKTQNALSSHVKSLAETMKSIELSSGIAELANGSVKILCGQLNLPVQSPRSIRNAFVKPVSKAGIVRKARPIP